jgi:hypothetical protein
MPIPLLTSDGYLPTGVHECTLDEIKLHFGQFTGSSRRPDLFTRLAEYVTDLRACAIAASLVVNGSFVTAKQQPNDIDLLLALKSSHDLGADLNPNAYNVVSKRRVYRRFGFDLLVARAGAQEYFQWIEFFQQVRLEPGRQKGILNLPL